MKAPWACHSYRVLDRPCYSSQTLNGPCYSSQTNQCYSSVLQLYFIQKIAGKSIHEARGHAHPKTRREESWGEHQRTGERPPRTFGSSPHVSFPPPGPALCKRGSQQCCLLRLRSSLRSSDLPLLFLLASPFLVFQPPPFWAPLSYSNYLTTSSSQSPPLSHHPPGPTTRPPLSLLSAF